MDEAIVVFSRKGIFQTTIAARDVRSREHARKLWPLVSPGASRQIVSCCSFQRITAFSPSKAARALLACTTIPAGTRSRADEVITKRLRKHWRWWMCARWIM